MTAPAALPSVRPELVEGSSLSDVGKEKRGFDRLSPNGEKGCSPAQAGFTLIEALVALAIVAVAAAGLIGATERHIDTIAGLERRAAARWVAENRLAELGLAGESRLDGQERVEMLGRQWQVSTTARNSADPDLRLVEVAVAPIGGQPLVRLRGFVDRGIAQ